MPEEIPIEIKTSGGDEIDKLNRQIDQLSKAGSLTADQLQRLNASLDRLSTISKGDTTAALSKGMDDVSKGADRASGSVGVFNTKMDQSALTLMNIAKAASTTGLAVSGAFKAKAVYDWYDAIKQAGGSHWDDLTKRSRNYFDFVERGYLRIAQLAEKAAGGAARGIDRVAPSFTGAAGDIGTSATNFFAGAEQGFQNLLLSIRTGATSVLTAVRGAGAAAAGGGAAAGGIGTAAEAATAGSAVTGALKTIGGSLGKIALEFGAMELVLQEAIGLAVSRINKRGAEIEATAVAAKTIDTGFNKTNIDPAALRSINLTASANNLPSSAILSQIQALDAQLSQRGAARQLFDQQLRKLGIDANEATDSADLFFRVNQRLAAKDINTKVTLARNIYGADQIGNAVQTSRRDIAGDYDRTNRFVPDSDLAERVAAQKNTNEHRFDGIKNFFKIGAANIEAGGGETLDRLSLLVHRAFFLDDPEDQSDRSISNTNDGPLGKKSLNSLFGRNIFPIIDKQKYGARAKRVQQEQIDEAARAIDNASKPSEALQVRTGYDNTTGQVRTITPGESINATGSIIGTPISVRVPLFKNSTDPLRGDLWGSNSNLQAILAKPNRTPAEQARVDRAYATGQVGSLTQGEFENNGTIRLPSGFIPALQAQRSGRTQTSVSGDLTGSLVGNQAELQRKNEQIAEIERHVFAVAAGVEKSASSDAASLVTLREVTTERNKQASLIARQASGQGLAISIQTGDFARQQALSYAGAGGTRLQGELQANDLEEAAKRTTSTTVRESLLSQARSVRSGTGAAADFARQRVEQLGSITGIARSQREVALNTRLITGPTEGLEGVDPKTARDSALDANAQLKVQIDLQTRAIQLQKIAGQYSRELATIQGTARPGEERQTVTAIAAKQIQEANALFAKGTAPVEDKAQRDEKIANANLQKRLQLIAIDRQEEGRELQFTLQSQQLESQHRQKMIQLRAAEGDEVATINRQSKVAQDEIEKSYQEFLSHPNLISPKDATIQRGLQTQQNTARTTEALTQIQRQVELQLKSFEIQGIQLSGQSATSLLQARAKPGNERDTLERSIYVREQTVRDTFQKQFGNRRPELLEGQLKLIDQQAQSERELVDEQLQDRAEKAHVQNLHNELDLRTAIFALQHSSGGEAAIAANTAKLKVEAAQKEYAITRDSLALSQNIQGVFIELARSSAQVQAAQIAKIREDAGRVYDSVRQQGARGITSFLEGLKDQFFRQVFENISTSLFKSSGILGINKLIPESVQYRPNGSQTIIGGLLDNTLLGANKATAARNATINALEPQLGGDASFELLKPLLQQKNADPRQVRFLADTASIGLRNRQRANTPVTMEAFDAPPNLLPQNPLTQDGVTPAINNLIDSQTKLIEATDRLNDSMGNAVKQPTVDNEIARGGFKKLLGSDGQAIQLASNALRPGLLSGGKLGGFSSQSEKDQYDFYSGFGNLVSSPGTNTLNTLRNVNPFLSATGAFASGNIIGGGLGLGAALTRYIPGGGATKVGNAGLPQSSAAADIGLSGDAAAAVSRTAGGGGFLGGGSKGQQGLQAVADVGAVIGAVIGIKAGIKEGGARGAFTAIGSALGAAAVIDPEPVSKAILAASALTVGLVRQLIPDAHAQRKKDIEKYLQTQFKEDPLPTRYDLGSNNRVVSYDMYGNPQALGEEIDVSGFRNRPNYGLGINPDGTRSYIPGIRGTKPSPDTPKQDPNDQNTGNQGQGGVTINIQALDAQSILSRSGDIADSVRLAISQDHPIRREILGLTSPM